MSRRVWKNGDVCASLRPLKCRAAAEVTASPSFLSFLPPSLSCAGQALVTCDSQFRVMCVAVHPSSPEVFLCGGYSSAVKAWDSRCCKVKPINLR